jgi:membrane-associated protein
MSEVTASLLAWLVVFTYPVVGLTVLVAAVGVPLPSTLVVLAAAGIAADGEIDPVILVAIVLLSAVTGDLTSYSIGRWGGSALLGRLGPRSGFTAEKVARLERRFERWGGILVLATRIILRGLALPTNLIAGGVGYPVRRFFGFVVLGQGIWATGLVSIGFWYGSNWRVVAEYLDGAFAPLTSLAVAAILALILVRLFRSRTASR